MTEHNTRKTPPEQVRLKIPFAVHLACILLLVAVTAIGPLTAYVA
ncbi:MAG: hypothetical protein WC362_02530 [Methanoregula sp.]